MRRHRIGTMRLTVLLLLFLMLFGVVIWRLHDIGIRRHAYFTALSEAQASGASNALLRGNIFISGGGGQEYLVATNKRFPVLQMVPAEFAKADRSESVNQLVLATGANSDIFERAADSGVTGARTVLRRLTDEQVATLTQLSIPGVRVGEETDRFYPAGMLAADTIGFLGYNERGRVGQYGIESSYHDVLTGTVEEPSNRWDIVGQIKTLFGHAASTESGGTDAPSDVILTIDKNIQSYAQSVLERLMQQYDAASGVLIVQEPDTGRLLAIADSPSYDPNRYGSYPPETFLNGALLSFEPGSSFKPFTIAMGLDAGVITPDSVFDDASDVIMDGYHIKNFNERHFGRVTMTQVLEKSINTGVMWVADKLGADTFLNYLVSMGFGQRTGVDLPGESSGDISNLYTGRRINRMTASFGQGITVTPLQLTAGFSAIANGGKLMRPFIVDAVRDARGHLIRTEPMVIGTPFTSKTASLLRGMLTSVVDNGFDKARIPRYDVAGKTGTAQIADPKGGYLEQQYNHSFVGFAPAAHPAFVIFIRIERPKGITFAADSLSPAFRDMTLYLLNYFNIPPTR